MSTFPAPLTLFGCLGGLFRSRRRGISPLLAPRGLPLSGFVAAGLGLLLCGIIGAGPLSTSSSLWKIWVISGSVASSTFTPKKYQFLFTLKINYKYVLLQIKSVI